MKKTSSIFIIIFTLLTLIFLFSCQKFETTEEVAIEENEISLKDASFSPQFDWESTRKITLNITSEDSQIINITSSDKSIRYHKGMLPGNSSTYTIKISVPSNIQNLNVNNQELILSAENISIDL